MKKLLFFTLISTLFLSCSNENEELIMSVETTPTIIDDWSIEKFGTMNVSNEITYEEDWTSDCSTKKDYLLLSASSNFNINYFSSACESTFFAQENGTYTLNSTNNQLILTGGTDWDGTYQIVTLSASELIIKRIPDNGVLNSKLPQINFYKFSRRN